MTGHIRIFLHKLLEAEWDFFSIYNTPINSPTTKAHLFAITCRIQNIQYAHIYTKHLHQKESKKEINNSYTMK